MIWVFGYGSLMWNPGIPYVRRESAEVRGYHRAYLMYSTRNRGTPECPGMVLSLAPGGRCVGTAFLVEQGRESEALAYLDRREGAGRANRRVRLPAHRMGNGTGPELVQVWTYLPVHSYSNFIWGVPLPRQAELVARGCGRIGSSLNYLQRLLAELEGMGVREPGLERLYTEARKARANGVVPLIEDPGLEVPHMDTPDGQAWAAAPRR